MDAQACDENVGAIAWERAPRGKARAWVQTIYDVFLEPSRTARSVTPDGSLRAPLVFASIAIVTNAIGAPSLIGLIGWWHYSFSLERFGARESVGRIIALSDLSHRMVLAAVVPVVLVFIGPLLLWGAARGAGAQVEPRAAARAIGYASALLVVAVVPLIGLATIAVLPYFLHQWLGARTELSSARRTLAVAVFVLLAVAVREVVARAYELTLDQLITDLVWAWLVG